MVIYGIIVLAIIARFIPHMPNFAPITALAIFSAAYLPWKKAIFMTIAVRFISDVFLGFFSWPLMLAVYASHLAGILFGVWIKKTSSHVIPEAIRSEATQAVRNPVLASWIPETSSGQALKQVQDDNIRRWVKIIGSSLFASILFFLITNFAFLYSEYSHNISGIILAYANGLPFLRGTVFGDLGYTAGLFGLYEIAVRYLSFNKTRQVLTHENFNHRAS